MSSTVDWPTAFSQLLGEPKADCNSTLNDTYAPFWMASLIISIQDDYSEGLCYGRHLCPYECDLGEINGFYAYEYPDEPTQELSELLHAIGTEQNDSEQAERLITLLNGRMVYTSEETCMSTSFVVR